MSQNNVLTWLCFVFVDKYSHLTPTVAKFAICLHVVCVMLAKVTKRISFYEAELKRVVVE